MLWNHQPTQARRQTPMRHRLHQFTSMWSISPISGIRVSVFETSSCNPQCFQRVMTCFPAMQFPVSTSKLKRTTYTLGPKPWPSRGLGLSWLWRLLSMPRLSPKPATTHILTLQTLHYMWLYLTTSLTNCWSRIEENSNCILYACMPLYHCMPGLAWPTLAYICYARLLHLYLTCNIR